MIDKDVIRRAAIALETEAEDLYERAIQTLDRRARNRLMERRAILTRVVREMLEVTGIVGTRNP